MLRCKTNSAKERASGGPVSNSNNMCAGNRSVKKMRATKYGFRLNVDASWSVKVFAMVTNVARSTLQQVTSFDFFSGAFEWKGQAAWDLVSTTARATAPNAQWLDTENQAKRAKSESPVRMALECNVTTLIDLPKPFDVQSFYHDQQCRTSSGARLALARPNFNAALAIA